MGGVCGKGTCRRKVHVFKALPSKAAPASLSFLDFRAAAAFNPATFSERLSFRPADWPWRPEANARQRCAPSGVKVFGRSLREGVIPREGGDPVFQRRIGLGRGAAAYSMPRSSRGMTAVDTATLCKQDKGQRHCSTICRNGLV